MLNLSDIPTDPEKIAEDTEFLVCEDGQDLANAGVIIGQLDPTEIDLTTGQPRWNEEQRELIVKLGDALREWRDL